MHVDNDPPLNNIIVSRLNGILYYITISSGINVLWT